MKKQKRKRSPKYLKKLEAEIRKHSLRKQSPSRDKGFGKYKQDWWDGTEAHKAFIDRRQHVAGIKSALTKGFFVERNDLTKEEFEFKLKWICFSGKYRRVSKDPRLDKMRETERKEFSKELGQKLTKAEYRNMSAHKKESLRKKIARNRDGTKKKRRPRKR